MPVILQDLTSEQFEKLPRRETVFFFPVGGIEDHGPHLPMSLDLDEALAQCKTLGTMLETQRPGWTAVIMPGVPFAVDPNTRAFAFPVRAHVLRDWLVDSARNLKRMGFVHGVCFSGSRGPRQLTTIEEAGKSISRFRRLGLLVGAGRAAGTSAPFAAFASLTSALTSRADLKHSAWWPAPSEHGGARDTSVGLALGRIRPGVPPKPLLPAAREIFSGRPAHGLIWNLGIGLAQVRKKLHGYWGTPNAANLERGQDILKADADTLYRDLSTLLDGASADSLFRSWYSVLPANGSFFRAWILLLLFLLSLGLWAQWLTRGFE